MNHSQIFQFLTIPNILKEFNPNLYGYSEHNSYSYKTEARLNVAEPIAMSADIFYQAENLLKRMRNNQRVDMEKHWKVRWEDLKFPLFNL